MTINSEVRTAGPYTGSGGTGPFSFAFEVFATSELLVQTKKISDGTIATLALTTDYTVSLNANQNASPGGTITLVASLSSAYTLTMTSAVQFKQATQLTNNGPFFAKTITTCLDRLTILAQQVKVTASRAIKFPIVDGTSLTTDIPAAAQRANKALIFDGSGNVTVSVDNYNDQLVNVTAQATAAAASADAAALDKTACDADVVLTHADVVTTGTNATAAAASASAASTSASAASTSATNAATSATNAATSATAAASSATAASGSATTASTQATNAAASATTATTQASNASTSATNAATSATASASSATAAATSATAAAASATSAQNYATALTDTSTTSLAIGTGSKTFTCSAGKQFAAGQFISAVSAANNANYMHGQVTSYSGTTLVVNVTDIGGSGTKADWNLSISGSQGSTGATGATGSIAIAAGGGTVDAITATPSGIALVDQALCAIVSAGANTSTTPTFAPNGLTAHTITARGGAALVAGDTGAAGYIALYEYNLANTRWELLNPAKIIESDITLAANTTNNVSTTKHGFAPVLPNDATKFLDGTGAYSAPGGAQHATTFQYLKSGSSATYTTPANCTGILVRAVGGGGGGGGGGTGSPTDGGSGGTTTFNSINALGGSGGQSQGSQHSNAGNGTGTADLRIAGSMGGGGTRFNATGGSNTCWAGGIGGCSPFGGAGTPANGGGVAAKAAQANSGSGGGGGNYSGTSTGFSGAGGDAGEYFQLYIASPASTYTYTIGAVGSAGSAGTSGDAGAAGGTGLIIVEEFYG